MSGAYARQRDRVLVAMRGGAGVRIDARGGEMMADVLNPENSRLWQVCATVLGRMQREGILLRTIVPAQQGNFEWSLTNKGKELAAALPIVAGQVPVRLKPLGFDEVEQVGRWIAFSELPPFPTDPRRGPQPRDQIGRLILEWRLFRNLAAADPKLGEKVTKAIEAHAVVEEQFGAAWRNLEQRGTEA